MSLPIDRTAKATLDANLVNGILSDGPKIRASEAVVYDTIDELYNFVTGLISGGVLLPNPAFQSRQGAINENFDVWQRGTSFSTTGSYTADRWALFHDHTSVNVSRQETFLPDGSRYVARLTNTTRGVGTFLKLIQVIETMNCLAFINKTITASFKVRKNSALIAGNLSANVSYTTAIDDSSLNVINGTSVGSVTTSVASLSTSFQTITFAATIPAAARTLGIQFGLTGSPTDGGYIEVTQAQLNTGTVALPFQPRSLPDELALCMRYFEPLDFNVIVLPARFGVASILAKYPFKVQKRIAPTLSNASDLSTTLGLGSKQIAFNRMADNAAITATGNVTIAGDSSVYMTKNIGSVTFNAATSFSGTAGDILYIQQNIKDTITGFDAEL